MTNVTCLHSQQRGSELTFALLAGPLQVYMWYLRSPPGGIVQFPDARYKSNLCAPTYTTPLLSR
jgi:hypothetical protein